MRVKIRKYKNLGYIIDTCTLCGSGAGAMKVELYKGQYLCLGHLTMQKLKDSASTKKKLKDGEWFSDWFESLYQ